MACILESSRSFCLLLAKICGTLRQRTPLAHIICNNNATFQLYLVSLKIKHYRFYQYSQNWEVLNNKLAYHERILKLYIVKNVKVISALKNLLKEKIKESLKKKVKKIVTTP